MNILKNLLFSTKWKIGRADYIYGIVYVVLVFLVCIDPFIDRVSVNLIGGGTDIGLLAQYICSVVGLLFFAWSFSAVVMKRLRALHCDPWWSITAFVFPPLLLVWLLPDREKFEYRGGLSLVDQVFFYILIVIVIVTIFSVYRLSLIVRFVLFLSVMVWAVMVYFFWHDKYQFQKLPRSRYTGLDTWIDLGFVLVIVFFVRSYVISPFQIIGPSMESSFHGGTITYTNSGQTYSDGEFILVDKMSYRFSTPVRGDVVVFSPGIGPDKRYLIKRIIGTPGDVVKIENGYVYIALAKNPTKFQKLDESSYLQEKFGHTCLNYSGAGCEHESQTFTVPAGRYFLMGDNRPQSLDARKCFNNSGCIGDFRQAQFVPVAEIQGRVSYSLGHFDLFGQILPYPTLWTLKEVIPFRGFDIQSTHVYNELK